MNHLLALFVLRRTNLHTSPMYASWGLLSNSGGSMGAIRVFEAVEVVTVEVRLEWSGLTGAVRVAGGMHGIGVGLLSRSVVNTSAGATWKQAIKTACKLEAL